MSKHLYEPPYSPLSHPPHSDDIFWELIQLQEEDPACDLAAFKSLVSANQYRGLYRLLEKHVPKGAHVLDWGAGEGHFSYALERKGYRASGYAFKDFHLRRYLQPDYELKMGSQREPRKIPYPAELFNAVTSVGVLEHVRESGGEELASLHEIWRVLKPDGIFLCYHLPNRFTLIERLISLNPHRYVHPYRFTERSIRNLCQQSSFEILDLDRYGILPRNTWNSKPKFFRNSPRLARWYNRADEIIGQPLSHWCQNYYFVAKKPRTPA